MFFAGTENLKNNRGNALLGHCLKMYERIINLKQTTGKK
jgi:hypothetical protein